jgi:hypothetical protein
MQVEQSVYLSFRRKTPIRGAKSEGHIEGHFAFQSVYLSLKRG